MSQRHFSPFCTWSWVSVCVTLHQEIERLGLAPKLACRKICPTACSALRSQRLAPSCGSNSNAWMETRHPCISKQETLQHPSHHPGPSAGREINATTAVTVSGEDFQPLSVGAAGNEPFWHFSLFGMDEIFFLQFWMRLGLYASQY